MPITKALALAVAIATTAASPVDIKPSRILNRRAAAPSPYPLAEACGNEWQYLNFDSNNANDAAHLQTLHDVICTGELRAISSWGAGAAAAANTPYHRYFPADDEEVEVNVEEVLMKIAGQSSTEGMIGELVGTFIVDNNDFGGLCNDGITLAYTQLDDEADGGDGNEKTHFCDIAWALPAFTSLRCANFPAYVSETMDSFARVALHEMMHYSEVGADEPGQIVDSLNNDNLVAYYPRRAHALVTEKPEQCENNADNYAWMSVEAWLSMNCTRAADPPTGRPEDQYFTEDPPAYTPGEPGDGDD